MGGAAGFLSLTRCAFSIITNTLEVVRTATVAYPSAILTGGFNLPGIIKGAARRGVRILIIHETTLE